MRSFRRIDSWAQMTLFKMRRSPVLFLFRCQEENRYGYDDPQWSSNRFLLTEIK